jgi:uncharacterized protein YqgQ
MYEKLSYADISKKHENEVLYHFKIESDYSEFMCNQNGVIYRKMKSGNWKLIENKQNHKKGYNMILINKTQYSRAKLVLYAERRICLKDKNIIIYHKNGNKLDCSLNNLEVKAK